MHTVCGLTTQRTTPVRCIARLCEVLCRRLPIRGIRKRGLAYRLSSIATPPCTPLMKSETHLPSRPSRLHANGGFTMIELMVVVSLVAILGAVATPSFKRMVDQNRIASQVNRFVGDLQFARSEAVKRGTPVSVCPSSDGLQCDDTDMWQQGWIVFSDPAATGTTPNAESILRLRGAWLASDTFVASPAVPSISYGREGFSLTEAVTLRLQSAPPEAYSTRCVSVNRAGHHVVRRHGAGECA